MTEAQGGELLAKLDVLHVDLVRLAVAQRYELLCLYALVFGALFLAARRSFR